MSRLSTLSISSRIEIFQWLISIAFVTTFLISPQLWIDHRIIPTAPVFEHSPLPYFINYLLIACLLVSVILSPLFKNGWTELVFCLSLLILVVFDLQRFQQEIYLFFLWMLMIGSYRRGWIKEMAILPTAQLSILAIYLMQGIMKLNPWFGPNIYSWVISPLTELPGGSYLNRLWFLGPISETGLGLLLIIPKTRRLAMVAAVGYHLLMLFLFGPFGNDYHQLMWPMQALLPLVVVLLFSGEFENPFLFVRTCTAPKLAVLLLYLLPVLHIFGYFDAAPSFASYDGRHYLGYVAVEEYVVPRLPTYIRSKVTKVQDHDKYLVPIDNWVSSELKVPFYHERRVYLRYKHWLEPYANHPGDVFVVLMQEGDTKIIQVD